MCVGWIYKDLDCFCVEGYIIICVNGNVCDFCVDKVMGDFFFFIDRDSWIIVRFLDFLSKYWKIIVKEFNVKYVFCFDFGL